MDRWVFVYSALGRGHLPRPPGLRNTSNNCYINSVLQCLLSLKSLSLKLCQGDLTHDVTSQPVTNALESFFLDMSICKDSCYSCDDFLNTLKVHWPQYAPGQQDDAASFMQFLLNTVHEETTIRALLPKAYEEHQDLRKAVICNWESRQISVMIDDFGIQTATTLRCTAATCSYYSIVCDTPTTYLTVTAPSSGSCSIQDCLQRLCEEDESEDAVCPGCSAKGTLVNKVHVGRLPPILILHISRFSHPGCSSVKGVKNKTVVTYPLQMDVKEFVISELQTNTKYELTCVTNHSGSLNLGHYTSVCNRDNRWFSFDDSQVSNTTSRRAVCDGAYILFYCLKISSSSQNHPFDAETVSLLNFNSVPVYSHPVHKSSICKKTKSEEHEGNINPSSACITSDFNNNPSDLGEKGTGITESPISKNILKFTSVPASPHPCQNSPVQKKLKTDEVHQEHFTPPAFITSHLTINPCHLGESKSELTERTTSFLNPPQAVAVHDVDQQKRNIHDVCEHPEIDLDTRDPLLTKCDITGASLDLSDLQKYKIKDLERKLKLHGLPVGGRKDELIDRILTHEARGKRNKIDPGFEGGKWHRIKRERLMAQRTLGDELPAIPCGAKVWNTFPSAHIPDGFNYQSITDYFLDIPDFDLDYKRGIVSTAAYTRNVLPQYHDNTSDDDISDDNDSEVNCRVQYSDLCRRAIMKCISKGQTFLSSGRVLSVYDAARGRHYFVKAQVQASMDNKVYTVVLILNKSDGSICGAECSCKAQALKKCGHVAAIAVLLWEHVNVRGYEAVTTTGRQCYWLKTVPPKDPGYLTEKQYPTRKNLGPRVKYDPRPRAQMEEGCIPEEALKKFVIALHEKNPTCLFVYHFNRDFSGNIHQTDNLNLDDPDDPNDEDTKIDNFFEGLAEKCSRLLWEMARKCSGRSCPFEVPNARGQHMNPAWHEERRYCVNPSTVKAFLGLTKDRAKVNFLRRKLWNLDTFDCKAMKEGRDYECVARETYLNVLQCLDPAFQIIETGLWKNPKYPQMACSPDGLIVLPNYLGPLLLEIKILTVLVMSDDKSEAPRVVNPENFENEMTKQQKARFYLRKNAEGHLELKRTHPYYYQIQMSLDILEIEFCHLFVWSKTGHTRAIIEYDPSYWVEKRLRLIKKHRELIVPEIILGRTKQRLPPMEMEYVSFHEDPQDNYFA